MKSYKLNKTFKIFHKIFSKEILITWLMRLLSSDGNIVAIACRLSVLLMIVSFESSIDLMVIFVVPGMIRLLLGSKMSNSNFQIRIIWVSMVLLHSWKIFWALSHCGDDLIIFIVKSLWDLFPRISFFSIVLTYLIFWISVILFRILPWSYIGFVTKG